MKRTKFLISSLALAGLTAADGLKATILKATTTGSDDPNRGKLFDVFKQDHLYQLAGHRSHASHSSHSSHRSGSGGYSAPVYTPPAPIYRSPAPLYMPPADAAPSTSGETRLPALSGRTELFTTIVRRVQLGLQAYGYYDGAIDGVVGSDMREALKSFQTNFSLKVTGTITPEVLDALKIAAQ